jgi:protein dithiol oxidoreductase (disulfide-forming)
MDKTTQRLKSPLPTIEDAARWYAKQTGVKAEDFVAMAKSFSIETQIKRSDDYLRTYKVLSTPTLVVNGRYVTDVRSAGGPEQLIDLVRYLATK